MSNTKKYTPVAGQKNDFKLAPETVAAERNIHEIQVRYPGVNIEERKAICRLQSWKPEQRIPELSEEIRLDIGALAKMTERNEDSPEKTHQELVELCERFQKEHEPAVPITASEYWYRLACILFVNFEDLKVDKDELNFKVIQEAYADFFGL